MRFVDPTWNSLFVVKDENITPSNSYFFKSLEAGSDILNLQNVSGYSGTQGHFCVDKYTLDYMAPGSVPFGNTYYMTCGGIQRVLAAIGTCQRGVK